MNEIIFCVEESPDGGYTTKALGEDIFTKAETINLLKISIADAVKCHFDNDKLPEIVRMQTVKDELFAIS